MAYLKTDASVSGASLMSDGDALKSTVILELLAQGLAGEEDAALDGTQRQIHGLGYLVVLVSGNEHVERDTVVIAE